MPAPVTNLRVEKLRPTKATVRWTGGSPPATTFETLPTITAASHQPFIVAQAQPSLGTTHAIQTADLGDGTSTWYEFQVTTLAGPLSLWWQVQSEQSYDKGYIQVNGAYVLADRSGDYGLETGTINVAEGTHTIRVTFNKDGSASHGFDGVRLFKVSFAGAGVPSQVRIDGGDPINQYPPYVMTGLAPGSSRQVEARFDDGSGWGAWTGITVTTPDTATGYGKAVTDDNPLFYLELNEETGEYLDWSSNERDFSAAGTPIRGAAAVRPGGSIKSVQSTGNGIARREEVVAGLGGPTFTIEEWVLLPAGNIMGSMFSVGAANNGWAAGFGSTDLATAGRKAVILGAYIAWMIPGYSFPDNGQPTVFHIVWTYNNGTWTLYVNGQAVVNGSGSRTFNAPNLLTLIDGQYEDGRVFRNLSSGIRIDSVSAYATVLSPARILAHYEAGAAYDISGSTIQNLTIDPTTRGGYINATSVTGATSYEWKVDGGAVTEVLSIPFGIGGLSAAEHTVEVRGKNGGSGTYTPWASLVFTPLAETPYDAAVLADNPEFYIPAQETAGTRGLDYSNKGRHATYAGGATLNQTTDPAAPGGVKSIRLDGVDDHIAFDPGNWITAATTGFSLEGWYRIREDTNWARTFDFGNPQTSDMLIAPKQASDATYIINTVGGTARTPNFKLPNTRWIHFVWTMSTAGVTTLYVNGEQWDLSTLTAPTSALRVTKFFGRSNQSADPYLKASATRFAAYNSVLSPARVRAHYKAGMQTAVVPTTAPVGFAVNHRSSGTVMASWNDEPGASGYEYRVDGGAPVASASNIVSIGSLSVGAHAFEVRQVNGAGAGPWSAVVNCTVKANLTTLLNEALADNPVFFVGYDEPDGVPVDRSGNLQFEESNTALGKPRVIFDDGRAASTVGTNQVPGLWKRSVPPGLTGNMTFEGWYRIPEGNLTGGFFKIGSGPADRAGWGLGIGQQYGDNNAAAGRQLTYVADGIAWYQTGYVLPALISRIHLVVTRNGSVFKTYVNNVLVSTLNFSPNAAGNAIVIGAAEWAGRMLSPTVEYDAVAAYSGVLSDARILAHYNAGNDISGLPLTGVSTITWNTTFRVAWNALEGATGYEYRVDGGSPVATADRVVTLTGLTNNQNYLFEVRGTNTGAGTVGAWTPVTVKPVPTLVFDSFDRAAVAPSTTALGAPDQGPAATNWTQSLNIGINAQGQAYVTANAENLAWFPNLGWNQDIEIQQRGANAAQIIFRVRDANNLWMWGGNLNTLYRREAGTWKLMYTHNKWVVDQRIRVVTYESSIRLYINGKLAIGWTDDLALEATDKGAGIRMDGTTMMTDWFKVKASELADILGLAATPELPVPATPFVRTDAWLFKGRNTKLLDSGSVV